MIERWRKKTKKIVRLKPIGIDSTFFLVQPAALRSGWLVLLWNSSSTRPAIHLRFLREANMNKQFLIWENFELKSQSPLILGPDVYNGIAKLLLCLHVVLMNQIMFIDRKLTFDYYIIGILSTNKYCLEWEFCVRIRNVHSVIRNSNILELLLRWLITPSNTHDVQRYTYINIHWTYDFRFFNYVHSV